MKKEMETDILSDVGYYYVSSDDANISFCTDQC